MPTTAAKDAHKQKCCCCEEACGYYLRTLHDYIGGGTHYWVLSCDWCSALYTYDNHASKLQQVPRELEQVLLNSEVPDKGVP